MSKQKSLSKIGISAGDKVFYTAIHIYIAILLILVAYPLIFIISSSFSPQSAVTAGKVVLWPCDINGNLAFSLNGYKAIFQKADVLIGYRNTIIYTVVATCLNLAMTMIAAFPLSRKDMPGRRAFSFYFTFTMLFSGGMIPTYLLIKSLGLLNNPLVMIIPGAINVYNLIIARTFMESSIPTELLEASKIDGCSDLKYFFKMVLPLSKSVIAVLVLYYALEHWNAYFAAFMYLNNRNYWPLQLFLREILLENQVDQAYMDIEIVEAKAGLADLLKYSLIIVSTVPVMILYPFIQKHFVTGVMIGSVKG